MASGLTSRPPLLPLGPQAVCITATSAGTGVQAGVSAPLHHCPALPLSCHQHSLPSLPSQLQMTAPLRSHCAWHDCQQGSGWRSSAENTEKQVPSSTGRKGARPRTRLGEQPHHATQCRSENPVLLLTSKPAAAFGKAFTFLS